MEQDGGICFYTTKSGNMHQDKSVPAHSPHSQRGRELKHEGWRGRTMLTAFKTPMGILCHCILSAPLLASTISQHSVRFCLSPNLSDRISHPLLLQLLAASLPISPSIPLLLCLLFYISTPPPFFIPLSPFSLPLTLYFLFGLVASRVELPAFSLSCHLPPPSHLVLLLPTTSSLDPTPLLLIGRRGGRGGGG